MCRLRWMLQSIPLVVSDNPLPVTPPCPVEELPVEELPVEELPVALWPVEDVPVVLAVPPVLP